MHSGDKRAWRIRRVEINIRLICADPAVNRDTCALKIKEYVTEDTELLENAEFKKLQKEYGIKAEGGNIWVGR